MTARRSAGLLLFRRHAELEVLLAHMGGPFWARKDERAWSIPKGEHSPDEGDFAAAQREFAEELGSAAPDGSYVDLGDERLPGGKRLHVWAVEADLDTSTVVSNTFELVWPPRSGRLQSFPEIDRAEWFSPDAARIKIVASQTVFLDRLVTNLKR